VGVLVLTYSSPLPELEPSSYGLGGSEAETILYPTEGLVHGYPHQQAPLSDIIHHLRNVYCGALSLESAHIMVRFTALLALIFIFRTGLGLFRE
jgi:2-oxoglutarate dehydrogenase complex dehydrogenase (E1) component-like enzyme